MKIQKKFLHQPLELLKKIIIFLYFRHDDKDEKQCDEDEDEVDFNISVTLPKDWVIEEGDPVLEQLEVIDEDDPNITQIGLKDMSISTLNDSNLIGM